MRECGTCKWFDSTYAPDPDPKEALGLCIWPGKPLPYALRYGSRERMSVFAVDGATCEWWEKKE